MKRQAVGFKREGHVVAQILRQRSFLVQRWCMRDDTDAADLNPLHLVKALSRRQNLVVNSESPNVQIPIVRNMHPYCCPYT
ncbi:hypothetical protein VNO77_32839 [Canavalia gladiata]|uniref:Uncharacterized protein n=1 Tax=Canavalia gladiata TaxID=3824 RepID=A0AAN9KEI8_CANGL